MASRGKTPRGGSQVSGKGQVPSTATFRFENSKKGATIIVPIVLGCTVPRGFLFEGLIQVDTRKGILCLTITDKTDRNAWEVLTPIFGHNTVTRLRRHLRYNHGKRPTLSTGYTYLRDGVFYLREAIEEYNSDRA